MIILDRVNQHLGVLGLFPSISVFCCLTTVEILNLITAHKRKKAVNSCAVRLYILTFNVSDDGEVRSNKRFLYLS